MTKPASGLLAALAALALASPAGAQLCAGLPTADRQLSAGAFAHFPEGIDRYGVDASYNFSGPLSLFAAYARTELEEPFTAPDALTQEGEGSDTYTFGAAVELTPTFLSSLPLAGVSLCPVGSFGVTPGGEAGDIYRAPVGVGLGARLSAGAGGTIAPYVVPQMVFGKLDVPGLDTGWQSDFGLRGGVLVELGPLYLGAEADRLLVESSETVLGLRAGIRL